MQRLSRRRPALMMAIAALLALAAPAFGRAQAPAALVIILRDHAGAGVPGVTVIILDGAGTRALSRGTTDDQGVVEVGRLPAESVRIAVEGSLPGGAPLSLVGDDARGVALLLTAPPTRLDLRVEPDGRVIPDPARMILPDVGGPPAVGEAPVFPTALRAPTLTPAPPPAAAPSAVGAPAEPAAAPAPGPWPGLVMLALIIAAIVLVMVFWVIREGV